MKNRNIIFFDGVCNLCNSFVDFIIKHDNDQKFYFASLQGKTAQQELPEHLKDLNTVVLKYKNKYYDKSSAALIVLSQLGGIYKIAILFKIIPSPFRNFIYDQISKNRYKLFGQRQTCRLPSPEEKELFLD